MLEEMQTVYEVEVERHLSSLTAAEAELITAALQKVTGSTCDQASSVTAGA
jgi:hypothetical protein